MTRGGGDMDAGASVDDARGRAERAIAELAASTDPAAFHALLAVSERVGVALGESARSLAETTSWAHVGDASGTTRQAAWSRWH